MDLVINAIVAPMPAIIPSPMPIPATKMYLYLSLSAPSFLAMSFLPVRAPRNADRVVAMGI